MYKVDLRRGFPICTFRIRSANHWGFGHRPVFNFEKTCGRNAARPTVEIIVNATIGISSSMLQLCCFDCSCKPVARAMALDDAPNKTSWYLCMVRSRFCIPNYSSDHFVHNRGWVSAPLAPMSESITSFAKDTSTAHHTVMPLILPWKSWSHIMAAMNSQSLWPNQTSSPIETIKSRVNCFSVRTIQTINVGVNCSSSHVEW